MPVLLELQSNWDEEFQTRVLVRQHPAKKSPQSHSHSHQTSTFSLLVQLRQRRRGDGTLIVSVLLVDDCYLKEVVIGCSGT